MDLNIEKQNVIVNVDDDNINVKNEDTTMEIVVANDSKDIEVETPEEINIEIGVVNVSDGTNDHNKLINRDKENQHPIGAITGLEEALNNAGSIKDVQVNGKSVVGDDKIANVKVFTKTSELINDSGYINGIPEKYVTDDELNHAIKDKANKTDIPTKVSQLQNDKGYLTQHQDLSAYALKKDIPTKMGDLTNDQGFITNTVNNLTNYYLKSETYTKNEVNKLIGNIQNVSITIVDKLPSTGETNVIYFVSKTGSTNDVYDEWVYVNNSWEHIGSTEVDLSGYALKTEIPKKTSELTNDSNFVSDTDYIHTDNNFTDDDKSKLDGLENFSGDASDVSYIDNLGYDVSNVQEALDKAFDTLDNKMSYKEFTEQVGIISDLETEDTSNIVNAINELVAKGSNASDVNYEDNFDNGVADVQEAIDVAFAEIVGLKDRPSIEEYENSTIDLATFPVGVYYLKGIYTKIKYDSNKTMENIIKSDDQKVVLVALGGYGTKGKGVLFTGAVSSTQVFLYVFGNGTWTNYNVFNFITSSRNEKITTTWTFNALPISSVTPTAYNQLVTKQYVDNKFNQVTRYTDLGYIELDDYDGDVFLFMNEITSDGKYKFVDSYDEFTWLLEVETVDNRIGQRYWYEEEGFNIQYYRDGWYNEDEDIYEWKDWTNYLDWNTADYMFARKEHYHYSSVNTSNIRTWLDSASIDYLVREYNVYQNSDKKLFYVRVFANNYILNNAWKCMRYQEYYDIEEPSKIYKRVGTAKNTSSSATVTWGSWYVFEGYEE